MGEIRYDTFKQLNDSLGRKRQCKEKEEAERCLRTQLQRLGLNISRLRDERNLTQQDLAYSLGYTNSAQLSRIESGKTAPSVKTLLSIADILGVEVQSFFKGV